MLRPVLLSLLLAVAIRPASAAIVELSFQGTIDSSDFSEIPIGSLFSGTIRYDTNATAFQQSFDHFSYALDTGAMVISAAGLSFNSGENGVLLVESNLYPGHLQPFLDGLHFLNAEGLIDGVGSTARLDFIIDGDVFPWDLTPPTALPPSFSVADPALFFSGPASVQLGNENGSALGTIQSFRLSAVAAEVPEPISGLLAASGLALAAFSRRSLFSK